MYDESFGSKATKELIQKYFLKQHYLDNKKHFYQTQWQVKNSLTFH